MKLCVPDYILSLKPYVAGKPLEELEREYGISDAIKLASNENPLGPSPLAIKAIQQAVKELHRYPNGGSYHLCEKLSKHFDVEKKNIILGNGSDDIIAKDNVFLLDIKVLRYYCHADPGAVAAWR